MALVFRYSIVIFLIVLTGCDNNNHVNKNNTTFAVAESQSNCESQNAGAACCFENMPESLTSVMEIAKATEPGTHIVITGTIFHADGKTPFSNVILYAYHTDAKGIYSVAGNEKGIQKKHGRLHGWCRTGKDGRYEIRTIHPASYPNSEVEAHIHAAVLLPVTGRANFIDEFLFSDDPHLNKNNREQANVMEMKQEGSVFIGHRDIAIQ